MLVVQETKIDNSFPEAQFQIPGYTKAYRKDRNIHGGGILVYVRDNIPSKEVNTFEIEGNTEGIFIELNIRKSKWLLLATYKPPDISKTDCLDMMSKALDFHSAKYQNFIIMGDLNIPDTDEDLFEFLEGHNLSNLVNFPTCFKSVENPSTIDLILTNRQNNFQHTIPYSTGPSNFHKMVITAMKVSFPKSPPNIITYRDMKHFDRDAFRTDLRLKLGEIEINSYGIFEKTFFEILDKHAPMKKKYVRANHKPYVTKAMRVAIMKRSELTTKYRANPTNENKKAYKKQKNFCNRLYKKERKKYYDNIDLKDIIDNRKFWKTVKPFLSNKTKNSQKICLKEKDETITDPSKVANLLNEHFIDAVSSLARSGGCSENVLDYNILEDPIENVIHRFRHHQSITAINCRNFEQLFEFQFINTEDMTKEISKLDPTKTTTGPSIAMLKDNVDICAPILTEIFNDCIKNGTFADELKLADISPIFKSVDSTA